MLKCWLLHFNAIVAVFLQYHMNCSRYITILFFISLFIFNGVCSVVSRLLPGDETAIEKLFSTDTETEKKEAGERAGQEVKELFLNDAFPVDQLAVYFYSSERNTTSAEVMYKKDIHISIPTPPPEQA